jgi:hypothetical protein
MKYKNQYSAAIAQKYLPDDNLIDKVETCRTRNIYKKSGSIKHQQITSPKICTRRLLFKIKSLTST